MIRIPEYIFLQERTSEEGLAEPKTRLKKGMHSKPEIEPGNATMTIPGPNEEQVTFQIKGDDYLAGGIELYARIVEVAGRPGVDFTCEPAIHDREVPGEIAEFNRAIENMCRATVANFPSPRNLARFYREVKKDGSRNRCWYRVTVTGHVAADEQIKARVSDAIDPAFVRADPHVKFRAKQLRAMLQHGLEEEEV